MMQRGFISLRYFTGFLLGLALLSVHQDASAQEISARAATPRKSYVIGEEMVFAVYVRYPQNYTANWGEIKFPEGVEKLDSVKDVSASASIKEETLILKLLGFDEGHFRFPQIKVNFQSSSGDTLSLYSDTIGFDVVLVPVDTTREIIPIHEPLEVPYTFGEILPYIAGAILLIATTILLILYYRKRRKNKMPPAQATVAVPPSQIALQKLQALHNENLWARGEVKLYYIRLSFIIREYLEAVYPIDAPELTTSQIIELCEKKISKDSLMLLSDLLSEADLVKFAKFKPGENDMEKAYTSSLDFIKKTS